MLSFGEQLYRLTPRDEETLVVEPFFRAITAQAVGASQVALVVVPIPIDRCIYIDRVRFTGAGYAAPGLWTQLLIQLDARFVGGLITVLRLTSFAGGLASDQTNTPAVAGAECEIAAEIKQVYPPGMATVRFQAQTPAKAITADCTFEIDGYFIPPGRIGRR